MVENEKEKIESPIGKSEEVSSDVSESESSPEMPVEEVTDIETEAKVEVPVSSFENWKPKTELGRKIKAGEIVSVEQVLDKGLAFKTIEEVDALLPGIESELLLIGQSKGKFGGGQRRIFRQTQKKTREGNKPSFATCAVVGNRDGIVGIGFGKSSETVPAREKAIRKAKLAIMKVRRGSGSWEDASIHHGSIPFQVEGSCGSVKVKLIPAPKGTGLRCHSETAKILSLAGITDVWSKTYGKTRTGINLIKAVMDALNKLNEFRVSKLRGENIGLVEGLAIKQS